MPKISITQVEEYEIIEPLFASMYREIQKLCKKKPDATLNQTKVKMINALLNRIDIVLKNEKGTEFLYLLDDETLPQYSDAVLILSQYSTALEQFHKKHYNNSYGSYYWDTQERDENGKEEYCDDLDDN